MGTKTVYLSLYFSVCAKKQQLLPPQAVLLKLEMAYLAMQYHILDRCESEREAGARQKTSEVLRDRKSVV